VAKKARRLVDIEWMDSSSVAGNIWVSKKDARSGTAIKCRSVGILVKKTKKCIVVAGHETPWQLSGDMAIPRSAIVRMKRLK